MIIECYIRQIKNTIGHHIVNYNNKQGSNYIIISHADEDVEQLEVSCIVGNSQSYSHCGKQFGCF